MAEGSSPTEALVSVNVTLTESQYEKLPTTLNESSISYAVLESALAKPVIAPSSEKLHELDSAGLLAFAALLVLSVVTIWGFKYRRSRYIHESGLCIVYGAVIGVIVRLVDAPLEALVSFDPEVFYYFLLPPILLNAGYTMDTILFFRYIGPIMTFAFLGTLLSAVVTGALTFAFSHIPWIAIPLSFRHSMLFGALISATDTVTVLAVFKEIKVDDRLYTIVFGESALNDAVSIALYNIIDSYTGVGSAVGRSSLIVFGSIGIGLAVALFCALLTKHVPLREHHIVESTLFLVLSYSSYLIAEVARCSGIIAILTAGIVQSHYTQWNLSDNSRVLCKGFLELLNFIAENLIFCSLGVSLLTYPDLVWKPFFLPIALLIILFARAVSVFGLSFLLNLVQRRKLPLSSQCMLWFSGLRGAVAFALAVEDANTPEARFVLSTTLFIVVVTIFVCGSVALPVAEHFQTRGKLTGTEQHSTSAIDLVESVVPTAEYIAEENHDMTSRKAKLYAWIDRTFRTASSDYITPFFTRRRSNDENPYSVMSASSEEAMDADMTSLTGSDSAIA